MGVDGVVAIFVEAVVLSRLLENSGFLADHFGNALKAAEKLRNVAAQIDQTLVKVTAVVAVTNCDGGVSQVRITVDSGVRQKTLG